MSLGKTSLFVIELFDPKTKRKSYLLGHKGGEPVWTDRVQAGQIVEFSHTQAVQTRNRLREDGLSEKNINIVPTTEVYVLKRAAG
jgi:hypothetical protein